MKILFLDVDGVLNSTEDGYSIKLRTESHLELLRCIVEETDAKIVLSSSWRSGFPKAKQNLVKRLEEYGLKIIDSTPVLSNSCRGDEIRQWLNTNKEKVDGFVILDDDDDMAEFTDTNLIRTDSKAGLQKIDALRCIQMLNKQ